MPDLETIAFTKLIGATEPVPGDDLYVSFRQLLRRHNYFTRQRRFLIARNQKLTRYAPDYFARYLPIASRYFRAEEFPSQASHFGWF